jgi:FkbM family methyltransferase
MQHLASKARRYYYRAWPNHPLAKIKIEYFLRRLTALRQSSPQVKFSKLDGGQYKAFDTSVNGPQCIYFYSPIRAKRYFMGLDAIFSALISRYFPDPTFVSLIPGANIIDVGANIGEFTLACMQKGANCCIPIEPDPIPFSCLIKNVTHYPMIQPRNILLSSESGSKTFYSAPEGADSSIIEPNRYQSTLEMPAYTLDSLAIKSSKKNHILKVEAEGAEPEVLRGASEFILHQCRLVTVRASYERKGQSTMPECTNILHDLGLKTHRANDKQLLAWH